MPQVSQDIVADVKDMKVKVSAIMKKARELSGKSQSKLAEDLDTFQSAVSNTENGVTLPNFIVFDRWMQACNMEIHFVITKKDESLESLGLVESK